MRRLALAAALALGCGTDNSPAFSSTGVTSVAHTSSSSDSTTTSASTSTSTSGSAEDSAAASSSGVASTFDMAPPPDLGDPTPAGCKGKIDFVFAISALHTMATEQDQLVASLPGFIETIAEDFADFDAHVISINTDGSWRGDYCESPDWCLNKGNCGPYAVDYECGKYVDQVWTCDKTLGAGLIFNAGANAYNKPCNLYGGNRYIIDGEPDPAEAFQCIAQVGTFGEDPPLADSLVAALSPELNGPEGCNAGFLRPDALLVFVFIMDNEDVESTLSAKKVRDAVVAAKGGDEDAIVALAIIPQPLEGEPVPDCVYDSPPEGQFLGSVIEQFPYHADGDICAAEYATFFNGAAASLVHEACNSFIPQ
ncbi:hypothetical protein [Nannocystis punicea]|uniref:Uncharacterized protein n=1 Tax=Nannocystis punicea TaxID=2995304 RepID=A0ABY7HB95_9BACT|nr:hypothetical protein [Nannocystis poenicansa]WAS96538.1 hypothetical protein O0S08_10305 [Nannocystis poenicansa]